MPPLTWEIVLLTSPVWLMLATELALLGMGSVGLIRYWLAGWGRAQAAA